MKRLTPPLDVVAYCARAHGHHEERAPTGRAVAQQQDPILMHHDGTAPNPMNHCHTSPRLSTIPPRSSWRRRPIVARSHRWRR